jgi:nucleoside phosphorylase
VQYDFGKTMAEGKFIKTRSLDKPSRAVMSAISKLKSKHYREGSAISKCISNMLELRPMMKEKFKYQGIERDQLFKADYDHRGISGKACQSEGCDLRGRLVTRKPRIDNDPVVHYGLIGSANNLIEHGATREKFRREEGILCFEMEAAGLMDIFECVVIRGICDYSDSHRNDCWLPYAAAAAAAYAKELLETIPVTLPQVNSRMDVADVFYYLPLAPCHNMVLIYSVQRLYLPLKCKRIVGYRTLIPPSGLSYIIWC